MVVKDVWFIYYYYYYYLYRGALYAIDHTILYKKLSDKLITFIESYVRNRTCYVNYNGFRYHTALHPLEYRRGLTWDPYYFFYSSMAC